MPGCVANGLYALELIVELFEVGIPHLSAQNFIIPMRVPKETTSRSAHSGIPPAYFWMISPQ